MTFLQFVENNYIWIGILIVIILLSVIGYLAESTGVLRKMDEANDEEREKRAIRRRKAELEKKKRKNPKFAEFERIKNKMPEESGLANLIYNQAQKINEKSKKVTLTDQVHKNNDEDVKNVNLETNDNKINTIENSTGVPSNPILADNGEDLSAPLENNPKSKKESHKDKKRKKKEQEIELPSLDEVIGDDKTKNVQTDQETEEEDIWKF